MNADCGLQDPDLTHYARCRHRFSRFHACPRFLDMSLNPMLPSPGIAFESATFAPKALTWASNGSATQSADRILPDR
jgi:hypothetical protein